MSLTTQDFLDKGYKRFNHALHEADFGLQRSVFDENGNRKYFLTICVYDFTNSKIEQMARQGFLFAYDIVLYTKHFEQRTGYNTFHVQGSVEDIETFEKWIEHMYNKLNCIIDVHNN